MSSRSRPPATPARRPRRRPTCGSGPTRSARTTGAPRAAALAVATALAGDRVALTNSGWDFSRRELQHALGLEALLLLNDFEALAMSLPRLQGAQVRSFGPAPLPAADAAAATGTRAVVGPGTGLGVAGLVHGPQGWVAVPGEGGHASLAATDDFEAALLAAAWREHAHVSAERLLSGIGLPVLHAAVARVLGQPAEALSADQIVERGLSGADAVASRTLDAFCALLGGFAGNVALVLGARGGVYIGGGIVPRLGERFFASRFRERFEAKGRFRRLPAGDPDGAHHRHAGRARRGGAGAGAARPLSAARRWGAQNGSSFRSSARSASHTPASAAMSSEPPSMHRAAVEPAVPHGPGQRQERRPRWPAGRVRRRR